MDNKEPNGPIGSNDNWVPKEAYDAYKNEQLVAARKAKTSSILTRIFFILLAIGGLIVAIAFFGGLITPTVTEMKRSSMCTSSSFDETQILLNLIGYPILFIAGIIGAIVNRGLIRTLGIILIATSPIVGFVMFLLVVGKALCGV